MTPEDINNRFAFHPATDEEKRDAHTSVRQNCAELAHFLNARLPEGREKSVAVTKLEEVMFWGNAALARQASDFNKNLADLGLASHLHGDKP